MNEQIKQFLKLKNQYGEDVFEINKLGNLSGELLMSYLKPVVDISDPLGLYDIDNYKCGEINISELVANALADLIVDKVGEDDPDLQLSINFRSIVECFPGITNNDIYKLAYKKPEDEEVIDELLNLLPRQNPFSDVGANDPCPCGSGKKYKDCCKYANDSGNIAKRLTPQNIYDIAEKDMKKTGMLDIGTYALLSSAIREIGKDPYDYVHMDGENFVFNLGRWEHQFLENSEGNII